MLSHLRIFILLNRISVHSSSVQRDVHDLIKHGLLNTFFTPTMENVNSIHDMTDVVDASSSQPYPVQEDPCCAAGDVEGLSIVGLDHKVTHLPMHLPPRRCVASIGKLII